MKQDANLDSLDAVVANLDAMKEAREVDAEVLAQQEAAGDAATLVMMADACTQLGKRAQARQYYASALTLYRQLGDDRAVAATQHLIGRLYIAEGDQRRAVRRYEKARRRYRKVDDSSGEGDVLMSLAEVSYNCNELAQALEFLSTALSRFHRVHDNVRQSAARQNMGVIYQALGKPARAMHYYDQALETLTAAESSNATLAAATHTNIAALLASEGDYRGALLSYEMAAYHQYEAGEMLGEATSRYNMAMLALAMDDQVQAEQALESAIAIGERVHHPDLEHFRATLEAIKVQPRTTNTRHPRRAHRRATPSAA